MMVKITKISIIVNGTIDNEIDKNLPTVNLYELPKRTIGMIEKLANETKRYDIGGLIEWIVEDIWNRIFHPLKIGFVNPSGNIEIRTIGGETVGGEQ